MSMVSPAIPGESLRDPPKAFPFCPDHAMRIDIANNR